ncbi:MAG: hypothetical protein L6R38_006970 [Xanthoria sp. 2 TBL-2021]|nr:MAG: hypothetical protein L6R38_006970 [Xanthoria sp. 2 TBL-2021]
MSNYAIGRFLLLYFQAVQGVSAPQSGILFRALASPKVLAIVLMGVIVTRTGYYAPFMFLGAAVAIVGTSLLSRIGLETSTVKWAAYSVITGTGIGIGIQLPYTALQAVLSPRAIAIPIRNTIFVNSLLSKVPKHTDTIALSAVVAAGAANVKQEAADPHTLAALQLSISQAVKNTMYLALATISLAFLLAAGLVRKNLRKFAAKRKQAQGEQVEDL